MYDLKYCECMQKLMFLPVKLPVFIFWVMIFIINAAYYSEYWSNYPTQRACLQRLVRNMSEIYLNVSPLSDAASGESLTDLHSLCNAVNKENPRGIVTVCDAVNTLPTKINQL